MKISVVQQPPVYLNLPKTMERAIELVAKSAQQGCQMVVFPEAWFPGYPTFVWRLAPGAGMSKTDELYSRLQANSIDLSKNGLAPLQEAAKEHSVVIVRSTLRARVDVGSSAVPRQCKLPMFRRTFRTGMSYSPTRTNGSTRAMPSFTSPSAVWLRAPCARRRDF